MHLLRVSSNDFANTFLYNISHVTKIHRTVRLQLVKSLVIVIYFFELEMRDAVIIDY